VRMELIFWGQDYLTLKYAAHTLRREVLHPNVVLGDVDLLGLAWVTERDVYNEALLIPGVLVEYEFTVNEEPA
jgi:hypothetical protein